ncbi:hypothetical protein CEXT_681021 [Caerostris extrusa]|uniref:Sulfotransferase n=1 Tax=Caerostris extrusa TaxID=172846 RepID=A0AAV4WQ85_CAEEX|nr:hypothetical protein CEXT_681021 [Caerostris extrusa]
MFFPQIRVPNANELSPNFLPSPHASLSNSTSARLNYNASFGTRLGEIQSLIYFTGEMIIRNLSKRRQPTENLIVLGRAKCGTRLLISVMDHLRLHLAGRGNCIAPRTLPSLFSELKIWKHISSYRQPRILRNLSCYV